MLKFLGVSRSGYRAFLNRKGSPSRQRKEAVKKEIKRIYDSSVIKTINKAKAVRNTDLPLIIHSDRGSQYVSNAWRKATENMLTRLFLNISKPFITPSGYIVIVTICRLMNLKNCMRG